MSLAPAAAPPTWPNGDPNDVARDLLKNSSFTQAAKTADATGPDPWKPFNEWMDEHVWRPLHDAFHHLGNALSTGADLGAWIGLAIDVVFIALVVFLVVRTVLAFTKRRKRDGVLYDDPLFDQAGTVPEWQRRARELAARGDFAAAIAALFRGALAALDGSAVIAFDGARTPGEYRRLVRRVRPDGSPHFDRLADGFVYATYAPETPQRADFDRAEAAFSEFEPLVARAPSPGA